MSLVAYAVKKGSGETLDICGFTRCRVWCEAIVVCAVDGQVQVGFRFKVLFVYLRFISTSTSTYDNLHLVIGSLRVCLSCLCGLLVRGMLKSNINAKVKRGKKSQENKKEEEILQCM
jgi:hypothetical protein